MAVDYKNLKLLEASEKVLEKLKEIESFKEKNRPQVMKLYPCSKTSTLF